MKKKIIPLLLAAVMLTGLCACSGRTPDGTAASEAVGSSSSESDLSETTAESTTESGTERSAASSEETEETSVSDPSAESTTAQTTSASKPVVKVTTAETKYVKFPSGKVAVKIPKVTISGVNTSSVNSQIKKDITGKKWGASYSYYANDKIVSILVEYEGEVESEFDRRVYNISVSTGKIMSDSSVVKLFGLTDKKFFSQVKKAYKKDRFGMYSWVTKQYPVSKKQASKILKKLRNRNLKRISYKYVDPYVNSKGKLKWVSSRYIYNAEAGDIELTHT